MKGRYCVILCVGVLCERHHRYQALMGQRQVQVRQGPVGKATMHSLPVRTFLRLQCVASRDMRPEQRQYCSPTVECAFFACSRWALVCAKRQLHAANAVRCHT